MMEHFSVHPEARNELRDAVLYYRDASPQVALEFVESYETAIAAILAAPTSNPLIVENCRRKVLRRFPFSLFYTLSNDELRLLAVAHHKRRPYYWVGRS